MCLPSSAVSVLPASASASDVQAALDLFRDVCADAGLAFAGLDIADDDDDMAPAPETDAGDAPFGAPLLFADGVQRITQICWSRWQVMQLHAHLSCNRIASRCD